MNRYGMAAAILLFLLTGCISSHAQGSTAEAEDKLGDGVELRFQPQQRYYLDNQKITALVTVSNSGTRPIYIGRELGLCPTYWGGISLTVLDAEGHQVTVNRCGDPYRVDLGGRDFSKLISEHLILLYPGYSYSLTVIVESVPSHAGRYTLDASLLLISFTSEEKERLQSLSYPVLLRTLKAEATLVRTAKK